MQLSEQINHWIFVGVDEHRFEMIDRDFCFLQYIQYYSNLRISICIISDRWAFDMLSRTNICCKSFNDLIFACFHLEKNTQHIFFLLREGWGMCSSNFVWYMEYRVMVAMLLFGMLSSCLMAKIFGSRGQINLIRLRKGLCGHAIDGVFIARRQEIVFAANIVAKSIIIWFYGCAVAILSEIWWI